MRSLLPVPNTHDRQQLRLDRMLEICRDSNHASPSTSLEDIYGGNLARLLDTKKVVDPDTDGACQRMEIVDHQKYMVQTMSKPSRNSISYLSIYCLIEIELKVDI